LPKFLKSTVDQLENTIERWCYFFRYAEDTTDEDLKKIAEQAPIIKLAYDEIDKFHWNEKDLAAYEERIMNIQKEAAIWEQRLDDAAAKGIQIGEEKGRKAEKTETAKKLIKANMSIDFIFETTGLTFDEIIA
jgi:predicted transposase/invertase (TIGR01784 family)